MLFCRAGRWALVVAVVAAGMSFRANAGLYPGLSAVNFPQPSDNPSSSLPDFSLVNHYSQTDYLGSSNLPSLLANVPAQDLFT
jgi:hypothetical protein